MAGAAPPNPGYNPREFGEGYAHAAATARSGSIVSTRAAPAAIPTMASMSSCGKVAVNGRKVVLPQKAVVQYLQDANKLLIPNGLRKVKTSSHATADGRASVVYNTFLHIAGVPNIPAADRLVNANSTGGNDSYRSNIVDMVTVHDNMPNGQHLKITCTFEVGTYTNTGAFVARRDLTYECYQSVIFRWGTEPERVFVATSILSAGEAAVASAAEAMDLAGYRDQLSDFIATQFALNYSPIDAGFLTIAANTWSDDACQTPHDDVHYTPRLSPYTMSMVAALNLSAVSNFPRLAWVRAYGVACGLLPSSNSCHHTEYMVTDVLPENQELSMVVDHHGQGEAGQMYIRGCLSLIAAFGALHLANDHTYKQNDDTLKRKGKTIVQACRTTLGDGEAETLASDAALNTTIRTTSHCFGLSSTWGVFKDGQRLRFIAEPLQIRDAVVPPPVAKVGVVVSQMNKIFALPVGKLFAENYREAVTTLEALKTQVVANATAYSALHKHYGINAQLALTPAQEMMVNDLVPIVAGYSQVFERDENNEQRGAMLSWVLRKAVSDDAARVALYSNAFENYAKKAVDLETLVSGRTASNPSG